MAKAHCSVSAKDKASHKKAEDGLPVHGFKKLIAELSTLCRVSQHPKMENAHVFHKLAEPTALQKNAFDLLGFNPRVSPCSQ